MIGSLGSILAVLGRRTCPRGEKMAGRFTGTDSQDLATILDPFGNIFVDLGPDRLSATCTFETSETSTLCVETRQMSVLATEDICPVSAADICPVSTADIWLSQLVCSLWRITFFRPPKPILPASVGIHFAKRCQELKSKRTRPLVD